MLPKETDPTAKTTLAEYPVAKTSQSSPKATRRS
jgi:hypothetical protein